jgi:tol-pal system protein YbgF
MRARAVASAVLVAVSWNAVAAEPLPDRRAVRGQPEAATSGSAAAARESIVDLTLQLESLQEEVRALRGKIEVQSREIDILKKSQRDLAADVDRRLRESAATPPAPTAPAPPVATSGPEQQDYDAAFALMKQGHYERASKGFRQFLVKYPQSALAGHAQYWIGEANYIGRNYKAALEDFTKVVNNYPSSPKVPDALLKVGFTYHELGDRSRARETLNQVVTRYPNTDTAKKAEERLGKMKKP